MYQVIIVVHVLLGLGIIGLILMQQGKGADAGAAFGSGSSGSVFGAQGAASFLSRTTAILATLFFTTSLTLAILNGQQSKKADLMDTVEVEQKTADVPLATTDTATVAPASHTPAAVSTAAPVSVTATPVVDSEKKDSSDVASKVDTDSKTADNKASADVTAKSETADSNDKKKASDKKSEKNHESDKKKSSDKHEKKHDSDADKKDKK